MKLHAIQATQAIITFLKKYGIFITPLVLFLLFMFLLVYSYTRSPKQSTINSSPPQKPISNTITNTPSISQFYVSPSTEQATGEGINTDEKELTIWSNASFDDSDFSGLNVTKTTLSDGSIQYSYDSDVPDRQKIVIIKDGINIFQRTPFTNTILSDVIAYYGNPDYIATGSHFWGPTAVTYIYLSKGLAIVGDKTQDQLYEQYIFQPVTIDQFKQLDTDMISGPQK